MKRLFLLTTLFFLSLHSFSQKKGYKITKKNGSSFYVKKYRDKKKALKLTFENGETKFLPYDELAKIEYEEKNRKQIVKKTKVFVRISNRNGMLMQHILEGKCNFYSYSFFNGNKFITEFYVQRENEKTALKIGTTEPITFTNYKKRALKYFSDCPKTTNKIKKKFKKRLVEEVVEFYNLNCS